MSEDARRNELETRIDRLERIVQRLLDERGMESAPPPRTKSTSPGGARSTPAGDAPSGAAPELDPHVAHEAVSSGDSRPDSRAGEPATGGSFASSRSRPAGGDRGFAATDGPAPRADRSPGFTIDTEKWLGRAGIGFVVLAFAFLLKLSFDRGWITPALRLVAGGAAGAVLLGLGLRLEPARRTLAQALLAGGIGLFYLVSWAGAELYGFFPFWLALSLMSTTTLLAFVLAERQDSAALGVMAIGGGLATPWVLEAGAVSEAGLAGYLTLVLLGGAALFAVRGWVLLLVTLLVVGWISTGSHVLQAVAPGFATLMLVGTYWAATVAVPLARPRFTAGRGDPLTLPVVRLAAVWGSVATVILLSASLELDRTQAGFVVLGLAALFTALAFLVRGIPASFVPAVEAVAVSVAVGLAMITWSPVTPLLLMVESAVLLEVRGRGGPGTLAGLAHGLGGIAALVFAGQSLLALESPVPGLHTGALPHLGVLLVAVVAAERAEGAAAAYRMGAYGGLLVWLGVELLPRANGQALVSIAWAVQGTVALVYSRFTRSQFVQIAGLGTLALVAGKLLLVDLSQLDPVWRILLFLGFGATLLGLGYWLNMPDGEGDSA